jgi:type VI secretion system protein ImpB
VGSESVHKKLKRVNTPRVHITYEVETNGAIEKVELPFVVGVLADLSGLPKDPLPPLKEREFVNIDHENFDKVMAGAAPRLQLSVQNTLTDENAKMNLELTFNQFEDFEPARIAEQVPALKALLEARKKLFEVKSNLSGNDKLNDMLTAIMNDTAKAMEMAKALADQNPQPEGKTNE